MTPMSARLEQHPATWFIFNNHSTNNNPLDRLFLPWYSDDPFPPPRGEHDVVRIYQAHGFELVLQIGGPPDHTQLFGVFCREAADMWEFLRDYALPFSPAARQRGEI